MGDVTHVHNYLKSRYVTVSFEWIQACIEWLLKEENIAGTQNLCSKVYEQWLYSDLPEVESCCLPYDVTNEKFKVITGPFALQVNIINDISQPSYSQLQKLRKHDIENSTVSDDLKKLSPWEPKSCRMLKLYMTDGKTDVQAIEYSFIPQINANLKPGTKILVLNSVTVRSGLLFLTKENVKVLGGEVNSLLICNASENVLARKLGLQESENPQLFSDFDQSPRTEVSSSCYTQKILINEFQNEEDFSDNIFENINTSALVVDRNRQRFTNTSQSTSHSVKNLSSVPSVFLDSIHNERCDFNYDEKLTFIRQDALPEITEDDDDIFMSVDMTNTNSSQKDHIALSTSRGKCANSLHMYGAFGTLTNTYGESMNSILNTLKGSAPFEYLCMLPKFPPVQNGSMTVKAFILTLVSRFEITDGIMKLRVKINDGSASCDVDISNKILEELVGMSCSDMIYKKQAALQNPILKQEIYTSTSSCQRKLISLCGLVKLYWEIGFERPIIVSISEISQQDSILLHKRRGTSFI